MRIQNQKRLFAIAFGAVILSMTRSHAPAQNRYVKQGIEGEVSIRKLNTMQDALVIGTPAQEVGMFLRLGVSKELAESAPKPSFPTRAIEIEPLDDAGDPRKALLFVPFSGANAGAAAELLLRGKSGDWHVSDEVVLDGWGDNVTYELLNLSSSAGKAVLAHGIESGHGTSFAQTAAELLVARNGKLISVLKTREIFSGQVFSGETPYQLEQKSTFLALPGYSIEETRASSREGRLQGIERRRWIWSESQSKFVAGDFRVVAGRPEPTPE